MAVIIKSIKGLALSDKEKIEVVLSDFDDNKEIQNMSVKAASSMVASEMEKIRPGLQTSLLGIIFVWEETSEENLEPVSSETAEDVKKKLSEKIQDKMDAFVDKVTKGNPQLDTPEKILRAIEPFI